MRQFVDAGLLSDAGDIYSLDGRAARAPRAHRRAIGATARRRDRRRRRTQPLARLLVGLGIRTSVRAAAGRSRARSAASTASPPRRRRGARRGRRRRPASSPRASPQFFAIDRNRAVVEKLRAAGVNFEGPPERSRRPRGRRSPGSRSCSPARSKASRATRRRPRSRRAAGRSPAACRRRRATSSAGESPGIEARQGRAARRRRSSTRHGSASCSSTCRAVETARAPRRSRVRDRSRSSSARCPSPAPARCACGSPRVVAAGPTCTSSRATSSSRASRSMPGHQVVGIVDALGDGCDRCTLGDRVGVAVAAPDCGDCEFCVRGEENLCERAEFTGWTVDGGYADALTVPEGLRGAAARGARRPRSRAAAVRGRDRVPRAAARRGAAGRARRADRLRRVGAPRAPGAAPLGLRVGRADARRAAPRARARARRVMGRRRRRAAARPCDRAVVFAPAGELVPVALQVGARPAAP